MSEEYKEITIEDLQAVLERFKKMSSEEYYNLNPTIFVSVKEYTKLVAEGKVTPPKKGPSLANCEDE